MGIIKNPVAGFMVDITMANFWSESSWSVLTFIDLGAIFVLRKDIGVGGWSRKLRFFLIYVVKMYLHRWVGGSKSLKTSLLIIRMAPRTYELQCVTLVPAINVCSIKQMNTVFPHIVSSLE